MDKDKKAAAKPESIKVTVHLPEKVTENIQQLKINKLYDILKPKTKNSK